jgi:hypothetical protein
MNEYIFEILIFSHMVIGVICYSVGYEADYLEKMKKIREGKKRSWY